MLDQEQLLALEVELLEQLVPRDHWVQLDQ